MRLSRRRLLLGLLANAVFGAWWHDPIVGLLIAVVAFTTAPGVWRADACACAIDPLGGLSQADCQNSCCANAG